MAPARKCSRIIAALVAAALLSGLAGCGGSSDEQRKKDAEASVKLGYAFLQERRPARALMELSKAEETLPDDPEIKNSLGIAYWAKREHAMAEKKFKEALQLNPAYSDVWNNLGALYIDMGRYEEAVTALEKALDNVFYSTAERALTNLGWALHKLGRDVEAKKSLEEAVDIAPGYPIAQKNLGIVLQALDEHTAALVHLDRTLELYPAGDQQLYFARGISLWKTERTDEAIESFDKSWRMAPDSELGKSAKNYMDLLKK